MTTQAWIILSSEQADAAVSLNGEDANQVSPMEISNPLANNLGHGALVGKFVLPARLLNDPGYARFVPTLGTYPIHVLDSETLFPPRTEE